MTPRLELRNLVKSYAGIEAVRGIDVSLVPGEFLSLLGPSGCGKSTTLTMIAGFERPTDGRILIDGVDVADVPAGRRQVGLVFQDYAVFSQLTVRDNLAFGLEAQHVPRAERLRRMDDIIRKLELEPILKVHGGTLNMSEMQRLALARVLVTEPRLLLLDEPMSNLDASLRTALRGELKLIQRRLGQTVLYVTHDQLEAMSMSDRIAVMHGGRIEQIGTPHQIYHHPATRFVAEFIGDPPINIVPCTVTLSGPIARASTALHSAIVLGRIDVPQGRYNLGVRPHDLHLSKTPRADGAETVVRFVENLGPENVVHVEYGDVLVAAMAPSGFAKPDERLWISFDPSKTHLMGGNGDRVFQAESG
jgi:multiple sugar transport system ATP-binding protein